MVAGRLVMQSASCEEDLQISGNLTAAAREKSRALLQIPHP